MFDKIWSNVDITELLPITKNIREKLIAGSFEVIVSDEEVLIERSLSYKDIVVLLSKPEYKVATPLFNPHTLATLKSNLIRQDVIFLYLYCERSFEKMFIQFLDNLPGDTAISYQLRAIR